MAMKIIFHQVRIESRKLEWTTSARTSTLRPGGHQAGGGDKKVSLFLGLKVILDTFGDISGFVADFLLNRRA